jgi:hypothetical protein
MTMKNKSKYASGGAPKPMTMAERVADRNRRMAEAMGDAPKPKPAPRPQKPKPYAEGGMVATGMPAPQPRPSDFRVGPLQFGGAGGMGGYGGFGGAGSPVGATGMPPGGPMGGDRPMREPRGMENMKEAIKDRLGGLSGRFAGMGGRMRPNAPAPVGPGGGYKKGGKIDGCATRGMTKGRNK